MPKYEIVRWACLLGSVREVYPRPEEVRLPWAAERVLFLRSKREVRGDAECVGVLVYSSINERSEQSREVGTDAIRVTLAVLGTDGQYRHLPYKAKRVNRTPNWERRLQERIQEAGAAIPKFLCPRCSAAMRRCRNNRTGEMFLGCPFWQEHKQGRIACPSK